MKNEIQSGKKKNKDNNEDFYKKKGVKKFYETTIITHNNNDNETGRNEMKLQIEVKDLLLFIKCYYYSGYFSKTFTNSFSLLDLKKQSLFFLQFRDIHEVFREIKYRRNDLKEYINSNEETSDKIRLIIPLYGINYESVGFDLFEVKKSENDILNEYKNVVNIYEKKLKIVNFDSKLLVSKDLEKEVIKFWISPKKLLKANLLYSFHDIKYRRERDNHYYYEFNKTVREFHNICDNHSKILIICKSNNEIFGGYTPLCFRSDDSYGHDNESFLFSINRLKKYTKKSFDNSKSIWRYRDYGPSFHYDLYFRKNKMNIVKFDNTNYLTPSRWVRENDCFSSDDGILLESLEIFQIEEINTSDFKYRNINYSHKNKYDIKTFYDNEDNNIISNSIQIDNNNENFIITNINNSDKNKLKDNENTPLNNMQKRNKNINNKSGGCENKKNSINISNEKNDNIEDNKISDKEKKEINNNKKESSIVNDEKYEIENKKIDISDIKEKDIKYDKENNIGNNNEKFKEKKDENKINHKQNQENQESKITIIINNEKKIKPENNNIFTDKIDNKDSDINNRKKKFIENDESNINDSSESEKYKDSDNEYSEDILDK